MLRNPTGRARLGLALLLALLTVLGPLNIDMYLPAFPEISADLGANASRVQLSLTACLVGLAVGQVVIGPLSDARGRRGPLLVCLALFVLASALCALAPDTAVLVLGRFLQGFTASAGVVLSRAVVRDVFDGAALTRFFALIMAVVAVAPMAAPVLGGGVLWLPFTDWRSIFWTLALLGAVIVLVVALRLPETLPRGRRIPGTPGGSLRTMGALLRDRRYLGYTLVVGLLHGGSFAYVAGTPFVYQDLYGVSPQVFGVLFGVNGIAIILGSTAVGRLSERFGERSLLRLAVATAVAATSVVLATALLQGPLVLLVVPIFVYMTCMGMVLTGSFALAMEGQENRAGSASSLLGALPMLIGAAVAPLVGLDESTAVPMGALLFGTSALGLLVMATMTRPPARAGEPGPHTGAPTPGE
ncbi:putative MFS-type transporter YdgK [Nocardiopsis terrae]|uniref:DHA1 family bicyclomycin/chloramphenicol resistance-like MFS transporter n=1 Tax=Nocardiopsis terrae TaxID=372655 RepID=A0ABR9HCI3_9ACTN|nr:multidrug effflux MFS transporter [Nocardiopsis terrae]MBE1456743.1 DHA1 family bicyclomycin/chloramphenicol resistance-like MFS transporter [Nocardiopsis terrae]GHC75344.1 putative MFS-type transporter YdgK [Nocardiopsis terrae]